MTVAFSTALNNERLNVIRDTIDAGAGAGLVRLYDSTRPASGGAATTLLAELVMTDPSAPNAAAGVLTMSAINDAAGANATGTATWFRTVDSNGNFVIDGDAGASGSGADLILNDTKFCRRPSWFEYHHC